MMSILWWIQHLFLGDLGIILFCSGVCGSLIVQDMDKGQPDKDWKLPLILVAAFSIGAALFGWQALLPLVHHNQHVATTAAVISFWTLEVVVFPCIIVIGLVVAFVWCDRRSGRERAEAN
jgi:hypothetical protein